MNHPRIPLGFSRSAGAFVSATRTSPFGSTYSQRGCCSPLAKACARRSAAALGVDPSLHPTARATFTTGMRDVRGGGRWGVGPVPAATGSRAAPPHAHTSTATTTAPRMRNVRWGNGRVRCKVWAGPRSAGGFSRLGSNHQLEPRPGLVDGAYLHVDELHRQGNLADHVFSDVRRDLRRFLRPREPHGSRLRDAPPE